MQKRNSLFYVDSVRLYVVDAAAHKVIKPYIPQRTLLLAVGDAVLGLVIRAAIKRYSSLTELLGEFMVGMAIGKFDCITSMASITLLYSFSSSPAV